MTRIPADYFDRLYRDKADPWGLASRWYEQRKYQLTVAALPAPRYRSCFEPGCSIGVLTAMLAERCDRLLSCDHAAAAVAAARLRTRDRPNVEVRTMAIPDDWPEERFELIVLSEVGYYLDLEELQRCCFRITSSLERGGTLIAVHWRGVSDYPLSGDAVHEAINAEVSFSRDAHYEDGSFVLDTWRAGPV